MRIFETSFDLLYITFAIFSGIFIIIKAKDNTALLFGIMVLTLGVGDSFHLVPRIIGNINNNLDSLTKPLGFGKLMTSLTMTAFYVILYFLLPLLFNITLPKVVTVLVLSLTLIRVIFIALPQNEWFKKNSSHKFNILRNIPFMALGLVVLIMYFINAGGVFSFAWLYILLSFAFYTPVVFFADKKPAFGALMLPKTICYVLIICLGFYLI